MPKLYSSDEIKKSLQKIDFQLISQKGVSWEIKKFKWAYCYLTNE